MYIVKIPFSYQNISGKVVDAKIGDSLPDFEQWPYTCQKSHLNLDWVEKVDDPIEENISVPDQNLTEEVKPKKGRSSKK